MMQHSFKVQWAVIANRIQVEVNSLKGRMFQEILANAQAGILFLTNRSLKQVNPHE